MRAQGIRCKEGSGRSPGSMGAGGGQGGRRLWHWLCSITLFLPPRAYDYTPQSSLYIMRLAPIQERTPVGVAVGPRPYKGSSKFGGYWAAKA